MNRLGKLLLCGPACLLLSAPLASADTRYAAPGGTGVDPCADPSDPCSVYTAAQYDAPGTTLEAGDLVELAPGTYSEADGDLGPTDMIQPPPAVVVRGKPGAPRPVIVLQSNSAGWGAFFLGPGAEVFDVEVRNQAVSGSAITVQGGVFSRVIARSTLSTSFTCNSFEGTMLSSACVNEAGGTAIGVSVATAAGTHATNIRNSTFIATGPGSVGMDFAYFASSPGVIGSVYGVGVIAKGEAKDVIARGMELSGGHGATTLIELLASDYATTDTKTAGTGTAIVTPAGTNGNITAPPLLAADRIHQLPGSPTIDKGAVDLASDPFDVDRQAREIGLAPDIGADELRSATETIVNCEGGTLLLGNSMPCKVIVTDSSASPLAPTGSVELSAVAGTVEPSCALVPSTAETSSCAVTYTPTAAGVSTLIADYGGDQTHEVSSGRGEILVEAMPLAPPPPPPLQTSPRLADTRLTKKPPKKTKKRLAKFAFASDQRGATFQCKVDGRPFKTCSSPFERKVALGRHVFKVRAVNAQNEVDPSPAIFGWRVIRP